MKYNLKKPCGQCPFRRSSPSPWLTRGRVEEITRDCVMGDSTFTCHKTTDTPTEQHCAGALIMEEKLNPGGNRMTRIARMYGMFGGDEELKDKEDIFDSIEEMIDHHTKGNKYEQ